MEKNLKQKYIDTLLKEHFGFENKISRDALAQKMGVTLEKQKEVLAQINKDISIPFIISRYRGIFVCKTPEESQKAFNATLSPAKELMKTTRTIKTKMSLNNQICIGEGGTYTYEVYQSEPQPKT